MIFFSPDERRLRAGWRLAIHTVLLLVLVFVCELALLVVAGLVANISTWASDDAFLLLLNELGLFLAVTLATWLVRRFIDRRSFASLGLQISRQSSYDLLAGFAISFVMMGSIFAVELMLGWTQMPEFAWQTQAGISVLGSLALWLFIFILGGWAEELLSRGYHLQTLAGGLNLFWGVLISSAVFGMLHLGNPDASWVSTLGILLAGLFLALPYVLTRQLWLSIGLHIGWNFFEGVIFGFPVSGLQTYNLLQHSVTGPELWTGGAFGPEAGLLLLPALLFGSVLVYLYARPELRNSLTNKDSNLAPLD